MTNFDRILSEAKALLSEAEQRRLSMALVPEGGMGPDERARLHSAINESLDDIEADRGNDMAEFLEGLKAEA